MIWNIFLFLSVGVGYSVFTILKVSILDRNGDQLIVSAWIGISLISLTTIPPELYFNRGAPNFEEKGEVSPRLILKFRQNDAV